MIPQNTINTRQQGKPKTIPAPVGGLNGRDSLAEMDAKDAYLLDNWLPNTASVVSRKGNVEFVEALGAPVRSLEVYTGAAGDKLLAFAGGSIFNISTGIASSLSSGKNSDEIVSTMFSNAADAAQHLLMTTGLDTPFYYDGTSIADLTLTGMTGTASTLNSVFAFKGRVYFGQRDKLGFYYLPTGLIQGALSFFDLGQVSRLGGYLVAMASYSGDGGNGPRDYIVFITSKGECIIYDGYDPSDATNWNLVGRYYSAPPIGRKCTFNYNSDLVVITLEGAIPLSEIRRAGDAKASGVENAEYVALTSKLGKFLSDYNVNSDVVGWSGTSYPRAGLLIINVPTINAISGNYYHYVMNTTTKAWSRITNWNGICFAVFNQRLYFGKFDGRVMLGDEGRLDDGDPLLMDAKQAYNYFDDGSGNAAFDRKHFQWANMLVTCDGTPPLSAQFNVDYKETQPDYLNDVEDPSGAEWDTSLWDLAEWGADSNTQRVLITLNKAGVVGSLWARASLQGLTLEWFATGYVYTKLSGLLI